MYLQGAKEVTYSLDQREESYAGEAPWTGREMSEYDVTQVWSGGETSYRIDC